MWGWLMVHVFASQILYVQCNHAHIAVGAIE